MMKTTIDHVALRVTDLERSVAFYRDVMGFEPAGRRRIADGKIDQVVFRVGDGVLVLFHQAQAEEGSPDVEEGKEEVSFHLRGEGGREWSGGMDHVSFRMSEEDYRAVVRRLAQHGYRVHRGEEKNLGALGVGYATYFYDPDHIEVEIKRYADPPEQPGPEWYASGRALSKKA